MRLLPCPWPPRFYLPHLCLARRSSWLRLLLSSPARPQRFPLRDGSDHRLYRLFSAWGCLSSSVREPYSRHPPPDLRWTVPPHPAALAAPRTEAPEARGPLEPNMQ